MYLKRVDGPRTVRLKDGRSLTMADLPPADVRRWVASRKRVVVEAIGAGLISRKTACSRYALTDEELQSWEADFAAHGPDGLKVTLQQRTKQP